MTNVMRRTNWQVISPSPFPWEKEALDYIQSQFPSHEPYRAWSNFEFIADDGSLNEVDLLIFTPQSFEATPWYMRPADGQGDLVPLSELDGARSGATS